MWFLAALLALFGDVHEVAFHAAYIVFSIAAALAMFWLALRFSPKPAWATILFLVTPAFVVNGNSFETDVPFLAFWMTSAALFIHAVDRRSGMLLVAASLSMILTGLAAYQASVLIPILGTYLLLFRRNWYPAWLVLLSPLAAQAGWQLFERITSGIFPASILAGHITSYAFQTISSKLQSAVGFTVHAGWLVFPALVWLALRRSPWWIWTAALAAGVTVLSLPTRTRYSGSASSQVFCC